MEGWKTMEKLTCPKCGKIGYSSYEENATCEECEELRAIEVTLERLDGKRGYAYWETDKGLQVGMIDPLTQCKIVEMEVVG